MVSVEELRRARLAHHVIGHRRMLPGERAQLVDPMRVRQEAHVHHHVGVHRQAVLEAERLDRDAGRQIRIATECPLDAFPQAPHRQRGGVDDQVGGGAHRRQHPAFGRDALGQRLPALQRVAAPVLFVAAHQHVVGCFHEHHPRVDVAGGQFVAHLVEITGEAARSDVHDHRQLGDPRSGGQPEIHHAGDELGWQVVGDIPAEVLEHLGRRPPSGPRQAGDQDDVNPRDRAPPLVAVPDPAGHAEAPDCSTCPGGSACSAGCGRSASTTAVAVATPIPGTAVIWSTVASLRRAIDPK